MMRGGTASHAPWRDTTARCPYLCATSGTSRCLNCRNDSQLRICSLVAYHSFLWQLAGRFSDRHESARSHLDNAGRRGAGFGRTRGSVGRGGVVDLRHREYLPLLPILSSLPVARLAGRGFHLWVVDVFCAAALAGVLDVPGDVSSASVVRLARVARADAVGPVADLL